MEILNEEEANASEAKDIMNKREKEGELVYEQKICLEYLDKVASTKNIKELIEELKKITIFLVMYANGKISFAGQPY